MSRLGRQRELSLVIVMLALGGFVFAQAPQFLSASNLSQVAILAAIIAIAATGQALVVLTRNVDLSVDAMIGVVAFSVADILMTTVLRFIRHTDLVAGFPVLDAYVKRCEARPAFQKALSGQMTDYAHNAPVAA